MIPIKIRPLAMNITLCILLGLLVGCSGGEVQKGSSSSQAYRSDSMAIAYAATKRVRSNYQQFPDFDSTRHRIRALVDTILYSPDSLKLFSIVLEQIPETESTDGRAWYFNGRTVIGIRTRRDTCWTLYPESRPLSPINFGDREELSKVMRSSYFGESFRDVKGAIFENGEIVSAPFRYNPSDSLFWTQGLHWRKGAHIDGFYYFQTVRDPRPGNMAHALRKRPFEVSYPDSIRKMYGACGE
mgnify:FL=1